MIEKQLSLPICTLRSDNGGEFASSEFHHYCRQRGIKREFTAPYSSGQNGLAERKNHSLQKTTRALLKQAGLPLPYWGEAVVLAAYLHNRLLGAAAADKTPFELLYGRKPSTGHLRIFGAPAYAHIRKEQIAHAKLSDRAQKLIFIGFTDGIKAYKLYNPITHQVIYSRSVLFDERKVFAAGFPDSQASVHPLADVLAEPVGELSPGMMTAPTNVTASDVRETDMVQDINDEITPDVDHASVDSASHASSAPSRNQDEADLEDTAPGVPPVIQTRTLRSREAIKPLEVYSPTKWQSSKTYTDWNTLQPIQAMPEAHYVEYAWHSIQNPHMRDVKDYLWPGHRLTAE